MKSKPAEFYDRLAADYAVLTDDTVRRPAAARFAVALRQRHPRVRSVLDVATGTGLFALAAAAAGFPVVTGLDPSAALLAQARQAAPQAGPTIQWLVGRMETLAERITDRFDLLLCMGNSLPHLTGPGDLERAAAGFRACLQPGGVLYLHLLNYPRRLATGERVIGLTRDGTREFIRFQDPPDGDGLIRFNVLTIDWSGPAPVHALNSVPLRPFPPDTVTGALRDAGFSSCRIHGGLDFAPFDGRRADTVLIEAR